LRTSLGRVSALVFLLCAASFVIVLTLGGGPAATTLEVAIYQSLRMDFDVTRAVSLSLVQILVCGALVALTGRLALATVPHAPMRLTVMRFDGQGLASQLFDFFLICSALALIAPPLAAVFTSGLRATDYSIMVLQAMMTSVGIGIVAALISCALAWSLAQNSIRTMQWQGWLLVVSLLAFIVPPAVIATGWFILTKGWAGGTMLALCAIVLLNALVALPFAVSVLVPGVARNLLHHDSLCAQLGVAGILRLRLIDGPAMARPLAQAFLVAFVLSLGDLTAVTLLGSQGLVTLPSLIAQQMGAYRGSAAGGTALVLIVMCYGLTLLAQRIGRSA
jgi:thiamine transport system permease protein